MTGVARGVVDAVPYAFAAAMEAAAAARSPPSKTALTVPQNVGAVAPQGPLPIFRLPHSPDIRLQQPLVLPRPPFPSRYAFHHNYFRRRLRFLPLVLLQGRRRLLLRFRLYSN